MKEGFLERKLSERRQQDAFRQLRVTEGMVDFCSNDYLGIAHGHKLAPYMDHSHNGHGSAGSRLLAGNTAFALEVEAMIARFHEGEAALIYNSGYDANLGLLSSVAQKADTIIYDQLSHASIRDGIRLGFAQSFSFRHNDVEDLEKKLASVKGEGEVFVVTESVFSMDGDQAPLAAIVALCKRYNAHLIVDEAHGFGVIGDRGEGLLHSLGIHQEVFARVYTYGKAAGVHGASVVGSRLLKDYLVNFSRSLIYTTALPPVAIDAIRCAYQLIPQLQAERQQLGELIQCFRNASIPFQKLDSYTPIQGVVVPGNEAARKVASSLAEKGMDSRAILYPTVPKGGERLRIVLHAFNTVEQINDLLTVLAGAGQ
ncbi:8-amino-7-oxononanoate synthase [Flavihumibacter rivuli]|uniref:aminotransferase class I/II-fold pyridoxal phosphate-dependent enzyme n=1 Tax=Flavihumibacter rivuli TaxID=2838156 RepID=UPI001BDDEECA|nr:8-amino-7-oxononanoate synthase [Flavihumibacter rivuli]ULQ57798.1 8-amino-7-oxononanoate synthase [Flavihumibacter rivuli]